MEDMNTQKEIKEMEFVYKRKDLAVRLVRAMKELVLMMKEYSNVGDCDDCDVCIFQLPRIPVVDTWLSRRRSLETETLDGLRECGMEEEGDINVHN